MSMTTRIQSLRRGARELGCRGASHDPQFSRSTHSETFLALVNQTDLPILGLQFGPWIASVADWQRQHGCPEFRDAR
jgi:hypothetical protein